MANTRIVELFIDDEFDESGIEAISLVSRPAHDETWLAFKHEEVEKLESPYQIAAEDFCSHNPKLDELGESHSDLLKDGWEVVRLEKITPQMVYKMQQEKFSSPNDESQLDTETTRVRFKYIGPRDEKNRKFCAEMLVKNRVYRIEDIEQLSNPEFGSYNIFLFRGSYNCRHAWVRLYYKKQGQILNDGSSTKGRIENTEEVVIAADTRPEPTIRNSNTPQGIKNQWKPGTPRDGSAFEPFKKTRYEEASTKKNKKALTIDDMKN